MRLVQVLAWGMIGLPFALPSTAWVLGWVRPPQTALAGYCGDGVVQDSEMCDDSEANGCLPKTCTLAKSCKQLKDAYGEAAVDGVYTIAPVGPKLQVVCDMDADGGGYTFLKVAKKVPVSAKEAEAECANYGMRLLAPRSKVHLAAVVQVAQSDVLGPVGAGSAPKASLEYLSIFGIYPKVAYQGCPDKPFNSMECTTWTAFGDVFWVTSQSFPEPYENEPGIKSCTQCSLGYYWSNGVLTGYESINGNGEGAKSGLFLCEVPDMLPPLK